MDGGYDASCPTAEANRLALRLKNTILVCDNLNIVLMRMTSLFLQKGEKDNRNMILDRERPIHEQTT